MSPDNFYRNRVWLLRQSGFTLIEVLVVIAMMGLVYVVVLRNFSQTRTALDQTTGIFLADVRFTESKALAGSQYENVIRCGYGIERVNNQTYRIYVAPQPHTSNGFCTTLDRRYNSGGGAFVADVTYENNTRSLPDPRFEFKTPNWDDIFFEPPDPSVYIDNSFSISDNPEPIIIGPVGQACTTTNCRVVCVYPIGKVEVKYGTSC